MTETKEIEVSSKSQRTIFQEYIEAFVVAVILAIIIRALFVQAFKIPSGSMYPTLEVGDHILVNKLVYGIRIPFTDLRWPVFRNPERGDVIVFTFPLDRSKDFIKRVVGVGGDVVEIRNKKVILNGTVVDETYAKLRYSDPRSYQAFESPRDNLGPVKIPPGYLFVMGDNRDESHDSRFWKFVPLTDVKGKAFLIYYSAGPFPMIRWERFFTIIR